MAASECIFCRILRGDVPAEIVHADDDHAAFLDHRPLFAGHVLIVPRRHMDTFLEMPAELVGPFFLYAQRVSRAVERGLGVDGVFNAINNRISQSVPHVHMHAIPRRKKDGLKGFFWPRYTYKGDEARDHRDRIAAALEP